MDYSAFNSGFGDPDEESPFANQRGIPPQAHPNPLFPADDGPDQDPALTSPFTPYSPVLGESQHGGFGKGIDDESGFEPPGFGNADSPRIDGQPSPAQPQAQQYPDDEREQAAEGNGNRTEAYDHSQPQQQPGQQPQQPTRYKSHHPQQQQQQRPKYHLHAKITGLERSGRKDPILKFDVHTNLPKFRTTQFRDVRRTHPEFQKLAYHLLSSSPECMVPAVPPPSTSAGVGTDEDETRVRAYMQRWLNTICSNEVLIRDEEMVFFVESDFGYSPVVRRKQPATGVRRKVIKQFAPPPDDTPELEQARPVVKAFYLGTMETGQKVDRVVKARRGLGLAESALGNTLALIAPNESHQGMSNAFRKLGRTIQSVGDFHAAQATAEATTLADPLNYHSSDAFIVKETLTNRQILMRDLESARKDTRSKLQTVEVLKGKSSIRREKVDEAIDALDEANTTENHLDAKVQRVTTNLVAERRRWFARTTRDLRSAIRDHCLRQIEAERRTLATLETVRPDIRAIDASGGLSRLGRDAPPATRRASLAASQGPKGDAWSGVPRAVGVQRGEFGVPTAAKREERILEEEAGETDRLDAKNAASRLAGSTF